MITTTSAAADSLKPNGLTDDFVRRPPPHESTQSSGGYINHGGGSGAGESTGRAPVNDGSGWASYNGNTGGQFDESALGSGFGDSGEGQSNQPNRLPHGSRGTISGGGQGSGELVTVTLLPEKEGMFLFQHRNYEVKSIRRGSSVVRRFSDFVWLLDCLHKRYPFRRLPLLPPKRLQGEVVSLVPSLHY